MKNIFISYSHKDIKWKKRLISHLQVLEKKELCILWHDWDITPGRDWYPDIEKAINQAHLAVLLITKDFLDSDFIAKEEIPRFLKRRKTRDLIVVPLFMKPCAWKEVDWLKEIQGVPVDGQFVVEGTEEEIDTKLAYFTEKIIKVLLSDPNPDDLYKVEQKQKSLIELIDQEEIGYMVTPNEIIPEIKKKYKDIILFVTEHHLGGKSIVPRYLNEIDEKMDAKKKKDLDTITEFHALIEGLLSDKKKCEEHESKLILYLDQLKYYEKVCEEWEPQPPNAS